MKVTRRHDGAIVFRPETIEDREAIRKIIAPKHSKFRQFMHDWELSFELQRIKIQERTLNNENAIQNNRRKTLGRRFVMRKLKNRTKKVFTERGF